MTKEEIIPILQRIIHDYNALESPKYRHANLDTLKSDYDLLRGMKAFHKGTPEYDNIVNAISQTISRMVPKEYNGWLVLSERGINKVIPPVVKKKNHPVKFPFEWIDRKSGQTCYINNGYWNKLNYMVMDVVGYFLLLKKGENLLPKEPDPIFKNLESIAEEERRAFINHNSKSNSQIVDDQVIKRIEATRHWIHFDDKEFRKYTNLDMSSNEIRDLLLETSRVEFKLVFPVRLPVEKKKADRKMKDHDYNMNLFSRLFEFGYIDKEVRSDGIVQSREYYISFNTTLGQLFAHNLLSISYDWLENRFYNLPNNAQIFYRRFLLHNTYKHTQYNLGTIIEALNLKDTNITNLINTIETSAFKPLLEQGLIDSYEKTHGLYGIKYIIKKSKKVKPNDPDEQE